MPSAFLTLYMLPSVVLGLGIWLALFGLRELGLPLRWRRLFFTIVFPLLLAPVIVPAGIIFTAFVPNGLLALNGEFPMLHDPRLVRFAGFSFLITTLFGVALSRLVAEQRVSSTLPAKNRLSRAALVFITISIMLSLYYSSIPDRTIDSRIDSVLIESAYGKHFDALIALGGIDDLNSWQTERDRLEVFFANEPAVRAVAITDQRLKAFGSASTLHLLPSAGAGSCSSRGLSWQIDRIMRCTRTVAGKGRVETLKYRRASMSASGNEIRSIEIEFDYDALSERYAGDSVSFVTSGDENVAREYDERVQGTWRIRQRYRVTTREEVNQSGTLTVGARTDFGTYQVIAELQVESVRRQGQEMYSSPECANALEVCTWTVSVLGTLKIRGSRALIVFDDSFWLSDRVDIKGDMMIGRDDWGSATVYDRLAPR